MSSKALSIIQNVYASNILLMLNKSGMLPLLKTSNSVEALAQHAGFCPKKLGCLLNFLARTTDWLDFKPPDIYILSSSFQSMQGIEHYFGKFLGAYGGVMQCLPEVLSETTNVNTLIDEKALAYAFGGLNVDDVDPVAKWCASLSPSCVLDLACGSGAFIRDLCREDSNCLAIGIDVSKDATDACQTMIDESSFGNRLVVRTGDVWDLDLDISQDERNQVDVIHARSLMNTMFDHGSVDAVNFLIKLKKLFPGRLLLIVDYFGCLFSSDSGSHDDLHAVLQDVVQSLSNQGIPPSNSSAWIQIYSDANCSIVSEHELRNPDGLRAFLHVVQL